MAKIVTQVSLKLDRSDVLKIERFLQAVLANGPADVARTMNMHGAQVSAFTATLRAIGVDIPRLRSAAPFTAQPYTADEAQDRPN